MSEIEKLDQNLDNMLQGLDDADKMLQVLFDEQNIDKLAENISLGQYAELNNALAYHANSLYFMFLKANGFPVKDHKINQELVYFLSFILSSYFLN
ncbi:Sas10/Utp3/C1D family protein (macronuclear) [Tetrahymena thermophila SB210]|uniref:Nuclear nucleic acid-binding protein C1D n=1 Tax=Tetrahymena thermophila (strain SB210) TaxID=312017 RepID=W7X8A2_TETTS|nr:Sas10/Utp3/C1D family protein [Tetrahymena thermophila SB210]EWS73577.1 Sas10/Utp3/C1D family protein [Tetrahymena thermophila SB210]|eukprot:XP_012653900.1 Sas10/Utp3/C1D family protein [Tetrahymena thermophila SB210]